MEYKVTSGIFTCRLICAKINYFMKKSWVHYNKNNLIIGGTSDSQKCIDLDTAQKFFLYVWDNVVTIHPSIPGKYNFRINNNYSVTFSRCPSIIYCIKILLGKFGISSYEVFVNNIFDEYDKQILFRICFLNNLVEDNLLNNDIMHVILYKVFFDQIKN